MIGKIGGNNQGLVHGLSLRFRITSRRRLIEELWLYHLRLLKHSMKPTRAHQSMDLKIGHESFRKLTMELQTNCIGDKTHSFFEVLRNK